MTAPITTADRVTTAVGMSTCFLLAALTDSGVERPP